MTAKIDLPHRVRKRMLPRVAVLAGALLCGLLLGFGCSGRRATAADTQHPKPWLCDLDGGRYCQPCGGTNCPHGDSGWLCCSGGICVAVATAGECAGGVVGWCKNYTTSQTCNGGYCTETAICHDGE